MDKKNELLKMENCHEQLNERRFHVVRTQLEYCQSPVRSASQI